MAKTITIDPLTRIEGHLKIEVEIENGKVTKAKSSGTMFRGFEKLLEGKDPRDAPIVTSRFCGVCFSVHTMASATALDQAFGATVPKGGRILRNILMASEYIYDHIIHFYHLTALDYIDILKVADYSGSDTTLKAVRDKIVALVTANDAHPLVPRYKPDATCITDPTLVTTLVSHYLEALKYQMLAKRMGAIFGGRAPHYQSIVVGGVTKMPTAKDIADFRIIFDDVCKFVENTYVPDVTSADGILSHGPIVELGKSDIGVGHTNYLCFDTFPQEHNANYLLKGGVIEGLNPANIVVNAVDTNKITEAIKYSWYKYAGGSDTALHPTAGETEVDLNASEAYTFLKAPRYDSKAYEVGPLARMLVSKNQTLIDLVTAGYQPGPVARHACRAIETKLICDAVKIWLDELETEITKSDFKVHDTANWEIPTTAEVGEGLYDAPRGALGHWISIKDEKIERYQAVVPTTWNASPRDNNEIAGQYEEALIGCPVDDPDNPINIVRIIRSFDPCLACAVHVIEPNTNEIKKFIIDPMMGQ